MIRRIVLWAWRDEATAEQKLRAKEGLAYIWFASGVDGMDFGEDLGIGPTTNYGLAMERDHVDRASWDAYNDDPHHDRVGGYIDTITFMERTARIDYDHVGPDGVRGGVRHVAMYTWSDDAARDDRTATQGDVRSRIQGSPGVRAVTIGDDLGWRDGHADWVVEAHFDDVDAFIAYRDGPAARDVAARLASVTVAERQAQIQHRIRMG